MRTRIEALKTAIEIKSAENSVAKEMKSFAAIQYILSKYGFVEFHRMADDGRGDDFIAFKRVGNVLLQQGFQQKARFTLDEKKYYGLGLLFCFMDGDQLVVYDHDKLCNEYREYSDNNQIDYKSRVMPKWARENESTLIL